MYNIYFLPFFWQVFPDKLYLYEKINGTEVKAFARTRNIDPTSLFFAPYNKIIEAASEIIY